MKTKFLSIIFCTAAILGLSACQDVYEFSPTVYDEQFDSMTASFYDDDRKENNFPAEFDYDNHVITIVVPYTYPANSDSYLELQDLTRMRMLCTLKNGCILEPPLTWLDLSKDNYVTITDNRGVKTPFTIKCEIRKSAECEITDFTLPEAGYSGVINPNNQTITLVTADEIGVQLASVETSHGATLDPDPRVEALNYDNEPQITCIAQNGVDRTVYTVVKANPEKLPFGIREGSAKIIWAKKQADMGITAYTNAELGGNFRTSGSAGLGVTDDYLVLNVAGEGKAYYMNYKNGSIEGTIDLTSLGKNSLGVYNNHRMTSDSNGNLLFATSGTFSGLGVQLWKMKGIDGQLELITTLPEYSAVANCLSVTGDLDGDAIITVNNNGPNVFYRWEVKNGVIGQPAVITPGGYAATCWGNFDAVYMEPTLPSDYLTIGYVAFTTNPPNSNVSAAENRTCAWLDGSTNQLKFYGSKCITSNSVENAGDFIRFNNTPYYIHNVINTLGYGYGASLLMYDLSVGSLDKQAIQFDGTDVNFRGQYGAEAANATNGKAGNGNDVRFFASPDGFYLYIFFEFCNGYVGAIRCDCIDM